MERYNGETRTETCQISPSEGVEAGDAVFEQIPLDSAIDHNNAYKMVEVKQDSCVGKVYTDLTLEDNGRWWTTLNC
jgi:hypothetical protein